MYTSVRSSTRSPSAAEPSVKAMNGAKMLVPKVPMLWVANDTESSAARATKPNKMATPLSPAHASSRPGLIWLRTTTR